MTAVQDPPIVVPVAVEPFDDQPRRLSARTADDVASLVGSFLGSLALVWILYEQVLAFSGVVGFVICWWVVFVAMYMGVTALSNPWPAVLDRAASSIVTSGAMIVGGVLVWVIVYTFIRGAPALAHPNFYTSNMSGVRPTAPLSQGGIWFAIVGTLEQVGIATAISLPLGVGTAIYLSEVGGKAAKVVRTVVEAMTALPDLLAGLFVYAVLVLPPLSWPRDGLAVAIALSVTMTPIVARSAEVVLRVVPAGLREASLALGASTWSTVFRVVLPTARAGLATSLILGIARVAGETAPLLIVDQATTFWNPYPTHDPQSSLPLFVYNEIKSGENNAIARGYGAASLLLLLVLVLFIVARVISMDRVRGGRGGPKRPPGPRAVIAPIPGGGVGMTLPPSAPEVTTPMEPVSVVKQDPPPAAPSQPMQPMQPYVPPPPYVAPPPYQPSPPPPPQQSGGAQTFGQQSWADAQPLRFEPQFPSPKDPLNQQWGNS